MSESTDMLMVRYFDEYRWEDVAEGLAFDFVDEEGEKVAGVAQHDPETKLWRFEVILPEKYQWEGRNPAGIVYTTVAAKRVAELILLNTILVRS